MIWGIIRIGRYAAMAGGGRGPKREASPGTKVIVIGSFAALWAKMNWHSLVIVAGLGLVLFVILMVAYRAGALSHRNSDPLEKAMRDMENDSREEARR